LVNTAVRLMAAMAAKAGDLEFMSSPFDPIQGVVIAYEDCKSAL
jgi:hypothetical protein